MLKRISFYLCWVGLFGIVTGIFYYLIKAQGDVISYALFGGGIALVGLYIGISYRDVKSWLRWKRSTAYGFNAFILSGIVFAILGLLNFMGARHYHRIDFTTQKLFSLSPQTIKVLASLNEDVKITGFFRGDAKPLFDDLADKYKYYSKRIKVHFVDPDKDIAVAKAYKVKKYQTIVVEKGKRESRMEGVSEEKLTNAIIKVGKEKTPKVYFTTGHSEKSIKDKEREGYALAQDELKEEGYEVEELLLLSHSRVPIDCDVLVIAGPQKPFLDQEVQLIRDYLKRGGRAMVLLDPESKKVGLDKLLSEVGIAPQNDVVVDPMSTLFGQGAATPVISTYVQHEITKEMKQPTFYPLSQSIKILEETPNGTIKVEPLAKTSPNSWGETSSIRKGKAQFDKEKDHKGPLNLSVTAMGSWEKSKPGANPEELRLVVFGDSDFGNNRSFNFSGNGNMFLNSVAWLIEDEAMISVRPNQAALGRLMMTDSQVRFLFLLTVVILPLLILGSGLGVWWRRRKMA